MNAIRRFGGLLGLVGLVPLVTGCPGDPDTITCYQKKDLEPELYFALKSVVEERRDRSSSMEGLGVVRQPLYAWKASAWELPRIPVCWEDETYYTADEDERQATRRAIEETWNPALNVEAVAPLWRVRFEGWTRCSEGNADGVRIRVEDTGPHVKELGRFLKAKPQGMVLNHTFRNWSTVCSTTENWRFHCIRSIAVHEFGHALGLAHEQNRPDSPELCATQRQGGDGDITIGEWDLQSVMNYCNPEWNNAGKLSQLDSDGIRAFYYDVIDIDGGPEVCSNDNEFSEALRRVSQ